MSKHITLNSHLATPVQGILVREVQTLDAVTGLRCAIVSCDGYKAFKALPVAIDFHGVRYGLTGWNSDRFIAYYRTDALVGDLVGTI